jgi:hypothetical protein
MTLGPLEHHRPKPPSKKIRIFRLPLPDIETVMINGDGAAILKMRIDETVRGGG